MILHYNNFKDDLILEKIINESLIYFTPPVRKILRKVNDKISADLLGIEG